MNCPNCGHALSNAGESQDLRQGSRVMPYIDANGRRCNTANHYVADLIVAYECDGPTGCEGIWNWSRKTRRLTEVKAPLANIGCSREDME